ncbi:hypothetical protein [Dietzia sp. ANT_WB102]|uniref:hypothetical protein n=1 Tax=Dietzia sp. ANT_WB102 TaxID=2597345 RepID=UPI0011ED7AA4|nr:hypothetical protein [Dietzia sp. ANT_WB102]KAA0916469.1 hypothetical protein FQ137_14705 [Dietzia sp. ANT_WB102]
MGVNLGPAQPEPGGSGNILEHIFTGIAGIGDAFAAGLNGVINGLIDMVLGRYEGSFPAFVDGQIAINERFDLLQSISGYGTAYMTLNYWMGSGGGGGLDERGLEIPFRDYLGPHKNCELVLGPAGSNETGHWRLLAPGTWRAEVRVTGLTLETDARLILEVCTPDGTPYSRAIFAKGAFNGTQRRSLAVSHTFVVEDDGYTVHARWTKQASLAKQKLLGGTELSSFTLSRWDIDTTDYANAPEVPDGPEIG